MAREAYYHHPPQLVFQACINAVAYVEWSIRWRNEEELAMHIKTPFTLKSTSPTMQDSIDVELTPEGNRTRVWVDSNPRFQLWNWGQDSRNEQTFLEEVSREVERISANRQRRANTR